MCIRDRYYLMTYNLLFTSVPIILFAIFDQDVSQVCVCVCVRACVNFFIACSWCFLVFSSSNISTICLQSLPRPTQQSHS